eukprot:6161911-Prymnesium_polylepis.1
MLTGQPWRAQRTISATVARGDWPGSCWHCSVLERAWSTPRTERAGPRSCHTRAQWADRIVLRSRTWILPARGAERNAPSFHTVSSVKPYSRVSYAARVARAASDGTRLCL